MRPMREGADKLAQGTIVWADVKSPSGDVKRRPLVILTETTESILDSPIVGVAITTSFPDPPDVGFVELPWDPRGHSATRLRRRSAAACRWLVSLLPGDVVEVKGYVPQRTLLEIVRRVRGLNAET
ncbi:MAG: hypothetical protein V1790_08750 [Planctomycetota bacterium]